MILAIRRCLPLVSFLVALPWVSGAEALPTKPAESEARIKHDIFFLASPELEGRGPLTKGIDKAAEFIAGEFKKAGLKPLADGTYFQAFTIPGATLQGAPKLALKGPLGQTIALEQGTGFQPFGMAGSGALTAPLVFAGYGITGSKESGYDDYAGIDATGKIVVVLRDAPRLDAKGDAIFEGPRRRQLASFTEKLANAEKHKAVGVLFVNDADTAQTGDELLDFNYTALARTQNKLPALHLRRSALEAMLRSDGVELADLERGIDRDLKPRSRALTGWSAQVDLAVKRDKIALKNVVGILEGAGPLAKETVVVGAHYDHLGYGGASSAAGLKKMAIHHGADDNGSGTTGLLELARRFANSTNRQGRKLIFVAFSGEELGLFGSDAYCKNPVVPLAETASMFNLDMIGRLRPDEKTKRDHLYIEGSGTAKEFNALLETLNKKYDFTLTKKGSGAGPSDHASFYAKKIPVLFFWTGYHPEYHKPTDTADRINVPGLRKVVDLAEEVVTSFATVEKRPVFIEVKSAGGSPGMGPRLGVKPAAPDGKDGVVLEEVLEGEPAAKAGIKKGDRVVELAGKPVKTFENLVAEMANQRSGSTIDVVVVRADKKAAIKVELPFVPRLGIRPSYSDDKEGVLLDGVSDGQPAAAAGLKAGDRIVELGGQKVKDLESYMTLLPSAVKGDSVEAVIVRDGKRVTIKIKVR